MKNLRFLFELMMEYRALKYKLKSEYEILKFKLRIHYAEKIDEIKTK